MGVKLPQEILTSLNNTQTQTNQSGSSSLSGYNNLTNQTEEQENKDTTLGVVGRTLSTLLPAVGKGLTSSLDNISDLDETLGNYIAQKKAEKNPTNYELQLKAQETAKKYQEAKSTHLLGDKIANWEKSVDEKQQAIMTDNPTSKAAEIGYKASELAESIGSMLPTIAASAATSGIAGAVTGGASIAGNAAVATAEAAKTAAIASKVSEGVGLAAMWADVYSRSTKEAVDQGYDYTASAEKGFLDASLEVATEMMFGGIAGMGDNGWVKSSVEKLGASDLTSAIAKASGLKKAGLVVAKGAATVATLAEKHDWLGEAVEEMTSEVLSPFIERLTVNPDADNATLSEIVEAGIGGALISGVMGNVSKITSKAVNAYENAAVNKYLSTNGEQLARIYSDLDHVGLSGRETTIAENTMGTSLPGRTQYKTNKRGKQTAVNKMVLGLSDSTRIRRAEASIAKAREAGFTQEAITQMSQEHSEIWAEEAQARMDEKQAETNKDLVKSKFLAEDTAYQDKSKELSKAELILEDLNTQLDEAKGEEKTALKKKIEEQTEKVNALKKEAYKREGQVESGISAKLRTNEALAKYGQDVIDKWDFVEKVKDARNGKFTVKDSNGNEKTFTKREFLDEQAKVLTNGAKTSYKSLSKKEQVKAQAEATKAEKAYKDQIFKEVQGFADEVNKNLRSVGIDENELQVKVTKKGSAQRESYLDGVITFDAESLASEESARYYLSHEMLHFLSKNLTTSQVNNLYTSMEVAMQSIGWDYASWYKAIRDSKGYNTDWDQMIAYDKKKGKKFKKEDIIEFKDKKAREETLANFMAVAFNNRDVVSVLAVVKPDFVNKAADALRTSGVKNMVGTQWDYARLKMLQCIDEGLATPMDAETNKEKVQEAQAQASRSLWGDEYKVSEVDKMYSNVERAINQLTDEQFKSALGDKGQSLIKYFKKFGITEAELQDSGVTDYLSTLSKDEIKNLTKQDLIDIIDVVSVVLDEEIVSADNRDETDFSPWYQEFSTSGGENYKEYKYHSPNLDFNSPHWDETDVLVHARTSDFKTSDGKKVLLIEEIQSDPHNAGSKYGYVSQEQKKSFTREDYNKLVDEWYNLDELLFDLDPEATEDYRVDWQYRQQEIEAELEKHGYFKKSENGLSTDWPAYRELATVDTPYKNNKYTNYVFEQMLRHAVEGGYDYLAWTTAAQQDDRWDAGQDESKGKGKSGALKAYKLEYDQDIPRFARTYGGQFGGKVSDIDIVTTYDKARFEEEYGVGETPAKEDMTQPVTVHALSITPEMRSILDEGQPRYASRSLWEDEAFIIGIDPTDKDARFSSFKSFANRLRDNIFWSSGRLPKDLLSSPWQDTTNLIDRTNRLSLRDLMNAKSYKEDDWLRFYGQDDTSGEYTEDDWLRYFGYDNYVNRQIGFNYRDQILRSKEHAKLNEESWTPNMKKTADALTQYGENGQAERVNSGVLKSGNGDTVQYVSAIFRDEFYDFEEGEGLQYPGDYEGIRLNGWLSPRVIEKLRQKGACAITLAAEKNRPASTKTTFIIADIEQTTAPVLYEELISNLYKQHGVSQNFDTNSTEQASQALSENDISSEATRAEEYARLIEKYGAYENGTPRRLNTHTANSQTADSFMTNKHTSEGFSNYMRDRMLDGVYSHLIITDEDAKIKARKDINAHQTLAEAYNEAMNRMTDKYGKLANGKTYKWKPALDKYDIAYCEQVIVDMADRIKQVEEGKVELKANEEKDINKMYTQLETLLAQLCSEGTRAGQNLQAFALLKRMSPTGRLYYIEQEIQQFVSELVDRKGQSRVGGYRFIDDGKGNLTAITIPEDLREKMESCTSQEEMDAVEEEIIAAIAEQIPTRLTDRVVAWRYLAMLGNPRTHIRNMVSNYAMGLSVGVKDKIAGALEDKYLGDKTTGRTKTNAVADSELMLPLIDFADKDWTMDHVNEVALSGGKVGFQTRIEEARNKLKIGDFSLLDTASKKNSELLAKEDDIAAKRAYKKAFVNYCVANNLSADYFSGNTVTTNTRLAQARAYAINEAAKATYHDANALATHLNQIENMNAFTKIVVGGLVPFKKTPGNILKRGIEYSPIGLALGYRDFKKALSIDPMTAKVLGPDGKLHAMGEYSATTREDALDISKAEARYNAEAMKTKIVADAIDKMASGLTGTGIMMLGMLLGHLGLMKGAGDENDREEYYDQMLGQQEYSITIGDKNYTLDWLTPISMPLFTGVELMEMIDGDGELSFNEALDAVGRLADPVMNLSVLQGINDAMSSYDSGLGKTVLSAAESYAGQFIPTIFGQVARSIDPVRRTSYTAKEGESVLGNDLGKLINKMENKIPGLSSQNAAYVDMWGRQEVDDGNIVTRLVNNAIVPWYTRDLNKTKTDDLVSNLYAQTGDRSVIPNSPESSFTYNNQKYYLMSKEYQATKELVGQISYQGVTSLASVPGFSDLTYDEQADIVSEIYSFARKVAKADYANANGIAYEQDKATTRLINAINAGLSIGEAIYINSMANDLTADKYANGKTISGSKKKKVLALYNSLGLTDEQIKAISIYED